MELREMRGCVKRSGESIFRARIDCAVVAEVEVTSKRSGE
jgi:hypothetical protein